MGENSSRKRKQEELVTSLSESASDYEIGPAMPSAELLAAAAKLTEAQAELRDIELNEDTDLFIGPPPPSPPPALVTEVESANEIEHFEEVTRIIASDADNSYDVFGANRNMLNDNLKKQYLKLSRMVHPDKCTHPEAHHAFIKLNNAFKDLQDLDKRRALDEKIKHKEEQEEMKAELQARLQVARKRDEWMTTLPPERKSGVVRMYSMTRFSKSSKEGRGDTSVWTDTPSVRAQKVKMNHLEASALAYKELQEKSRSSVDAELVVHYNKTRRSKSMVEKHQETAARSKSMKKSKHESVKEEWKGNHPWKPWDREKDLIAARQNVKLDASDMSQSLTFRFSF